MKIINCCLRKIWDSVGSDYTHYVSLNCELFWEYHNWILRYIGNYVTGAKNRSQLLKQRDLCFEEEDFFYLREDMFMAVIFLCLCFMFFMLYCRSNPESSCVFSKALTVKPSILYAYDYISEKVSSR